MYRLKYYSLTKEEKNKLKEELYNTNYGKTIKLRLTRLLITGILLLIIGIYYLIDAKNVWNYAFAASILMTSLFFIYSSFKVRITKLNDYLVQKKKK